MVVAVNGGKGGGGVPRLARDPIAICLLLVGAFVAYQAQRLAMRTLDGGPGPGVLPLALGVLMVVVGLRLVLIEAAHSIAPSFGNLPRVGLMVAALAVYAVGLERLGFVLTSSIATALLMVTFNDGRRRTLMVAGGIAAAVVTYGIFYQVLKVQLPPDPLGVWR
jgi:hypothetical protein